MRSERHLLRLAADRLSLHCYLDYNLDEPLPDHSNLTRIRACYELVVFRRFFDAVVEQCQHAGLVWGQGLYVDATQALADAALDSRAPADGGCVTQRICSVASDGQASSAGK